MTLTLNIFIARSGQSQNWTKKKYKLYLVKSWKTHRTITLPTERFHLNGHNMIRPQTGIENWVKKQNNSQTFFNPPVAEAA